MSVSLSVPCLSVSLSLCLSVSPFASEVGVIIMNIKYFISFSFHTPHEVIVVVVVVGDLFGICVSRKWFMFCCRFVVVACHCMQHINFWQSVFDLPTSLALLAS